mgnify:CR=1 FL=1
MIIDTSITNSSSKQIPLRHNGQDCPGNSVGGSRPHKRTHGTANLEACAGRACSEERRNGSEKLPGREADTATGARSERLL